jgi:hypothetical protein
MTGETAPPTAAGADAGGPSAPVIGSLGMVIADLQSGPFVRVTAITLGVAIVGAAVSFPSIGSGLADAIGPAATIWVLAAIAIAIVAVASLVVAVLPSFLLAGPDREATAVHTWVGAREVRRVLGSASAAIGVPTSPAEAAAWLEANPSTERLRPIRIEALLMTRRFDEARLEAGRLPIATPLDRYRRIEADALIADQAGESVDERELREAVAAIPRGVDRAEAAASMAIILARRALPDGDWRGRLLEARPLIAEPTRTILLRDHVWPVWTIVVRKVVAPTAAIIVAIAAVATLTTRG